NAMAKKPKALRTTFFNWRELSVSILQGLAIASGTLFIYRYSVGNQYDENLTRTMVFTVLIVANIMLTLVNRSFYYSVFTTWRYKNNMVPFIIFVTIVLVGLIIYIKPLADFF